MATVLAFFKKHFPTNKKHIENGLLPILPIFREYKKCLPNLAYSSQKPIPFTHLAILRGIFFY